jgi:hypothetical protein
LERTNCLISKDKKFFEILVKKIMTDDFPIVGGYSTTQRLTAVPAGLEPPFFRGGTASNCMGLYWYKE